MNEKENELYRITDNTIDCCSFCENEGRAKVTREIILGRCRTENVIMVRTLVACQLYGAGYTVSSIADFLRRTPQAIHHLLSKGYDFSKSSRAYRIAEREATQRNRFS